MSDHRCVRPRLAGGGPLKPVGEGPVEPAYGTEQSRRLGAHRQDEKTEERRASTEEDTDQQDRTSNHLATSVPHARRRSAGERVHARKWVQSCLSGFKGGD